VNADMGIAYERGIILFRQKRFDLAAQQFRHELTTTPNQARPHAMLCLCLLNTDHREDAEIEGKRALELDPNLAFGYYALSFVALREDGRRHRVCFAINKRDRHRRLYLKRVIASKKLMLTAVELDPGNADFLGQLAALYFDLGDFRSSLATAERGLERLPQHSNCADLRARSLARLGRHQDAIATVDRSLATNPEQAAAHTTRGWLLMKSGRVKEAHEHFLEALRLSPHDKRALIGLKRARSVIRPILGLPRRLLLRLPGGDRNIGVLIALGLLTLNMLNGNAGKGGPIVMLVIIIAVVLVYACIIAVTLIREKRRSGKASP
jgi:tetratricopeptide (TPR) repeat protein